MFAIRKVGQRKILSGHRKRLSSQRKIWLGFQENIYLEIKPNFSLTEKCFPLTNFSNSKQTQENLKSGFWKSEFQETNITLVILLDFILDHEILMSQRYFLYLAHKGCFNAIKIK